MLDCPRILEPAALEPIVLDPRRSRRGRSPDLLPALARLACALVGLTLPALGIAFADPIHRAGEPLATQAAAPVIPLGGAAVLRAARTIGPVRMTLLDHAIADGALQEVRP